MRAYPLAHHSWLLTAFLLSLCGCAVLPSGSGWGKQATIRPGWQAIKTAAGEAALDPWVWAPLAGAVVFQVDNLDRRTSDWAREHTPIFGSQSSAQKWSDDLRTSAAVLNCVTLLATPSGNEPGQWLLNKTKGGLVELAAIGSTSLVTGTIKNVADRERPNDVDTQSMPSGHASSAAVQTRLASLNLDSIEMDSTLREAVKIGAGAISVGTGWARVEAGWHYPSDTLVGMAIGNFFASFFNHAFLRADAPGALAFTATDGGAVVQWQVAF